MKDGNCVSSLIRAIEYELAGNVARVAHGLFCGCPIKLHEIQDIFQDIKRILSKPKDRQEIENNSTNEHDITGNSITTADAQDAIDGMEQIMDAYFQDLEQRSIARQQERKHFIEMLHSLETTVHPEVMVKAIIMLSEKLFAY